MSAGTPIYVRNWAGDKSLSKGPSDLLAADTTGRFLYRSVLDGGSSAQVQVNLDLNKNGRIDAGDKSVISGSYEYTGKLLSGQWNLNLSDFQNVVEVKSNSTWAISSDFWCFFGPGGHKAYVGGSDDDYAFFETKTGQKKFGDRQTYLHFQTDATGNPLNIISAWLPAGNYRVSCVRDLQNNEIYDSEDFVTEINSAFDVTGPGPVNLPP